MHAIRSTGSSSEGHSVVAPYDVHYTDFVYKKKRRLIVRSHDSTKLLKLVRPHEKAKDPAQNGETKERRRHTQIGMS